MADEARDKQELELRRIVRMLERTAKMAEHATLTGAMSGGREFAVRSHNGVLRHLMGMGEISERLFPPLPDDAGLDEVALASGQLAEYLRAGLSEHREKLLGDGNVMINLGQLGDVAELVRENLPEWLRARVRDRERGRRHGTDAPGDVKQPTTATTVTVTSTQSSGGLDDLLPRSDAAAGEPQEETVDRRRQILEELRAGNITADEAVTRLRET